MKSKYNSLPKMYKNECKINKQTKQTFNKLYLTFESWGQSASAT